MSLRGETAAFEAEVEQQAAIYIRDGIAGPWKAIELARETVLRRRQEAAQQRARNIGAGAGEVPR